MTMSTRALALAGSALLALSLASGADARKPRAEATAGAKADGTPSRIDKAARTGNIKSVLRAKIYYKAHPEARCRGGACRRR